VPASVQVTDTVLGADHEANDLQTTSKLTIMETAQVAAWWSAVWFVANWAVNASLAWTSVASVTILSSTSGMYSLAGKRLV
jgi:solute carrier family 35 protein F5